MIAADEDALICDLAETYHILDYKALPISLTAALCVGLRPDSRTKMRLRGLKVPEDLILTAAAVDRLSLLVWSQSADGAKGRNRPESLVRALLGEEQKDSPVHAYATGEDFESARKKLMEGGE